MSKHKSNKFYWFLVFYPITTIFISLKFKTKKKLLYKKAFYDKGNGFILCKIKWAEKFTAYCLYDRGKNDLVGKKHIYIFFYFSLRFHG